MFQITFIDKNKMVNKFWPLSQGAECQASEEPDMSRIYSYTLGIQQKFSKAMPS